MRDVPEAIVNIFAIVAIAVVLVRIASCAEEIEKVRTIQQPAEK